MVGLDEDPGEGLSSEVVAAGGCEVVSGGAVTGLRAEGGS